MTRLVLGVIGHVNHGKTTLVHALTGMQTDRLPEEQTRGISIALGFAHLSTGSGDMDFIDMPGHERFVRTMVSGATGIDAVLLVVDAREAVMPQTREHLDIAALLGVRRAVIAITRTDLADPARTAQTRQAAETLTAAAGLQAPPAIPVSARTGAGLATLLAALTAETAIATPRPDHGAHWLPIDRAFTIQGHGTIVTGTLQGGRLSIGDTLQIVPTTATARIRSLQVHGARVTTANPGQRVAANLRGVEPAQVPRGTALAPPGTLPPAAWLSVLLQAVPGAPPIPNGAKLQLLFGTEETEARLRLLDQDQLPPGASAYAQLHCARPVAVPAQARFVLRTPSPPRTIAGGTVLDPQTTRARRHAPAILARLQTLAGATPAAIVTAEAARAHTAGATLAALARTAGIGAAQAAAILTADAAIITRSGHAATAAAFAAIIADLHRTLAAHPDGLTAAHLARLMPNTAPTLLEHAADRLAANNTLTRQGNTLRIPRPDQDAARSRHQEAQAAQLANTLCAAGLQPPDAAQLAPDPTRRRLLEGLIRSGLVIRAPDRVQKRDILFHREAIETARRQLTPLLTGNGLLVAEIGAALGISRKFSVPLLEHLDSIHFTRRTGERRVLAAPR